MTEYLPTFRPHNRPPTLVEALTLAERVMDSSGLGWSHLRLTNHRVYVANDLLSLEATFRPSDLPYGESRRGGWEFLLDPQQVRLIRSVPDFQVATVIVASDDPDDERPPVTELSFASQEVSAEMAFYRRTENLQRMESAGLLLETWRRRRVTLTAARLSGSQRDPVRTMKAFVDPEAVAARRKAVAKLFSLRDYRKSLVCIGEPEGLVPVGIELFAAGDAGEAPVAVISGDNFRMIIQSAAQLDEIENLHD